MNAKEKCDSVYQQCRTLFPTSELSWSKLREMIETIKDIARENNISLYDGDLERCYKLTWNKSGESGSKRDFEISRDQLRDTALHIQSKLP